MRYIIILFFIFGAAKAQTLQQQINYLRQEIYFLKRKVDSLQTYYCENKLFYQTADGIFYWSGGADYLFLNDRFPVMCNGSKAILIAEDATIFCEYQDWNDGWVVIMANKSGKSVNAE
jgi:hypothetical protein